jgi:hypothetical protein
MLILMLIPFRPERSVLSQLTGSLPTEALRSTLAPPPLLYLPFGSSSARSTASTALRITSSLT